MELSLFSVSCAGYWGQHSLQLPAFIARAAELGLRGEELYDTAKRMAPHTVITTNADYVRFPRYQYQPRLVNYSAAEPDLVRAVKFGEGFIDYEAFFCGLCDGGFDGIANYEMCSPIRGGGSVENLDAYARGYVEWIREKKLVS